MLEDFGAIGNHTSNMSFNLTRSENRDNSRVPAVIKGEVPAQE